LEIKPRNQMTLFLNLRQEVLINDFINLYHFDYILKQIIYQNPELRWQSP